MKIVLYKNTEGILPLLLIPGVLFEKNRRLYRIVVRVDFDRLGATIKSSFLVRISAGCPGPLGRQQVVQALNLSTVPVVLSNAGIATSASSAFSRCLRALRLSSCPRGPALRICPRAPSRPPEKRSLSDNNTRSVKVQNSS